MNSVESMKQKGTGRPKSKVMIISKSAIVTAISFPPKTSAAA
jgi:hypothetical protein